MQLQTSRLKALDRDEKQYTCMACKKSFSKKNNFKRHTLTHTGVKPYNCALCGRGFSQKYNLKQHSHIHKEKPNMCHLCGHTVAANLTRHMKTHTGEKPYDARIVGNCRWHHRKELGAFPYKMMRQHHNGPEQCGMLKVHIVPNVKMIFVGV